MLSLEENQIYLYTSSLSGILDIRSNQTFILFTYGEMDTIDRILEQKNEQIKHLEEKNKLLKNEIAWMKDHTKYNGITEEYYIDGTMTATEAKLRLQQAEDYKNYVSKLEEENKNLKEMCGKLGEMNGKLGERVNNLEEENKRLKEENEKMREELSKKSMENWFDKKANNMFEGESERYKSQKENILMGKIC